MADAMRDHITECGEKIILQRSKEIDGIMENKKIDEFKVSPDFIDQLLTLHRKYATLIRKEFNNDSLFEKALVQAFQRIRRGAVQYSHQVKFGIMFQFVEEGNFFLCV